MNVAARVVVGGALVAVGTRALELGFDLLTRPNVVRQAEDATRAAVIEVPHPFTQEGTT